MLHKPPLITSATSPLLIRTHWPAECCSSLQGQPPWSSQHTAQGWTRAGLRMCTLWQSWLPPADALGDSLGAAAALLCPGAGLYFFGHSPGLPGHPWRHVASEWVSEVSLAQDRSILILSSESGQVPGPSWGCAHGCSSPLWKPTTASTAPFKSPAVSGSWSQIDSDGSSPAPDLSEAPPSPHFCLWRVGLPSFIDYSPNYTHTHMHICTNMETGLLLVSWKHSPTSLGLHPFGYSD